MTDPGAVAVGDGDTRFAILSMSARSPDGADARYLEWHLLDHLPEQYRIPELRLGQRWVSTPACRRVRLVAEPPFDDVDHVVCYLFADPLSDALGRFFSLGAALGGAGRMPLALPRRHLGGYAASPIGVAPAAAVGAGVLPWRPNRGVYLIVERAADADGGAELWDLPGVAGQWSLSGTSDVHERLASTAGTAVTIAYLDGDPVTAATAIGNRLRQHWASSERVPLLAAPFHAVAPWAWDANLPTDPT